MRIKAIDIEFVFTNSRDKYDRTHIKVSAELDSNQKLDDVAVALYHEAEKSYKAIQSAKFGNVKSTEIEEAGPAETNNNAETASSDTEPGDDLPF